MSMKAWGALLGCLALVACSQPWEPREPASLVLTARERQEGRFPRGGPTLIWSRDTRSPDPEVPPVELQYLAAPCGEWDQRLAAVASLLAARGGIGGNGSDFDQLTFALRASGAPYVWPAAWAMVTDTPQDEAATAAALSRWLSKDAPTDDKRRCGVAQHVAGTRVTTVAVVAAAPAELELPLPTEARVGQWLEFRARLRVPASNAKLVLLPPTGEPMSVPTQQTGASVRARFAAASRGRWLVQLLASGETGPRPMLEAMLFVDEEPSGEYEDDPVPGADAGRNVAAPEVAIDLMVTAMRQETGRPKLRRDAELDPIATEHARSMRDSRRIGHDIGGGSAYARLASANVRAHLAGENVAHAADAARIHRALWASPSHRYNFLHRGFTRWGLGVARDDDGSLWVCELFASDE